MSFPSKFGTPPPLCASTANHHYLVKPSFFKNHVLFCLSTNSPSVQSTLPRETVNLGALGSACAKGGGVLIFHGDFGCVFGIPVADRLHGHVMSSLPSFKGGWVQPGQPTKGTTCTFAWLTLIPPPPKGPIAANKSWMLITQATGQSPEQKLLPLLAKQAS